MLIGQNRGIEGSRGVGIVELSVDLLKGPNERCGAPRRLLPFRPDGSERPGDRPRRGVEGQAEGCGLVKGYTCTGLSLHGIDAGVWGGDVR